MAYDPYSPPRRQREDDNAHLVDTYDDLDNDSYSHGPSLERGYAQGGAALDPFFGDDDHLPPPSASRTNQGALITSLDSTPYFGPPSPNHFKDCSPLAQSAAAPAGKTVEQLGYEESDFSDDEDEGRRRPGIGQRLKDMMPKFGRGEKKLEGERVLYLNNPPLNDAQKFISNYVSTSKYNVITFVPKFLAEQFSKYANVFFLFSACIQQIPNVSPTNRYTTIVPLSLVLLASAFKEISEDIKRHRSDSELNARKAKVLIGSSFEDRAWRKIRVGDIVRLDNNDFIPADLVLMSSSEPEGLCYVETANLDGETNLKIKQASPQTAELTSSSLISRLSGRLRSEHPNNSLYTYEGTLELKNGPTERQVPLGPDQILLRGAQIRNTPWVYGLVVFTGHETKLMRNATAAPIKRTMLERQVNVQIVFLFGILMALAIASTIGASVRNWVYGHTMWYLALTEETKSKAIQFIEDILTFIILYNNLIPISLIVTMEVVKFQQAQLINYDLDMYYAKTDTPALCRTSSLVEELGQIEYIFSDKTGTLTCNEMEFKMCSIGGTAYAEVVDESRRGEPGPDGQLVGGWKSFAELRALVESGAPGSDVAAEFIALLSICHTVIPEMKDDKVIYQASSPDEAALVAGAEVLGNRFTIRKPKSIFVEIRGVEHEIEILNVCEFNSTRKRMSTVVRMPDGKIKLYTKGADTVILERLSSNQPFTEQTLVHLEDYATEGLRTLCLAMREIPEDEYARWSAIYDEAAATINGRGDALDAAAEMIEKDLFLLGATAIEDKLQDGVPDTIYQLQQAGIKVWVLTGDRQETAINIGLSCKLISESMNLIIVNEENAHDTKQFITKRLEAVKSQRLAGEFEELALIIDGKSLGYALEKNISKKLYELGTMCKAVVCCRVSPLQKALVVKLVKKNSSSLLLAIGDGANDVSMIQAAHVGVGISGVEGLQAARSSDVAISQFRYLKKLLLVHGAWSYQRLAKLVVFSFYKNICLYMTLFWYSFFNGYSGQPAYESWTLSFFNVLFTVLPPLVIGIFDQFVSARMLDRYPQLYQFGQSNSAFNKRTFWAWASNALYHSFLLYGFSVLIYWGDGKNSNGYDLGIWPWGTMLYNAVLLTVLGKAALVSDIWTKWTVIAIPGSMVFTLISLPLYAWITPMLKFSMEYKGEVGPIWGVGLFWFSLPIMAVVCLIRDYIWKAYKRNYLPNMIHIVQEMSKYNLHDYRPRQEQFQAAVRKVRAVQRMRRTRGFAFSQTEGTQEQARLIRAYDTSESRPSGL